MVINTTNFYILILVRMTLTLIQYYSYMKNLNCCAHFLPNFSIDLDEMLYAATTSWLVEAYAKVLSHN